MRVANVKVIHINQLHKDEEGTSSGYSIDQHGVVFFTVVMDIMLNKAIAWFLLQSQICFILF